MKISFAGPDLPESGVVVVGALSGAKLTPSAKDLDKKLKGAISRALKASPRFKGERDQGVTLTAPNGKLDRVEVVGLGKPKDLDAARLQAVGGQICAALANSGFATASVLVDAIKGAPLDVPAMAAEIGFGANLRAYRFDKYRTTEEKDKKPTLTSLRILCDGPGKARKAFAPLAEIAAGVFMTRDLVSEPSNVLYPETLAVRAQALTEWGVDVEVLTKAQMEELGMGALLGVAQGSVHDPRLVIMRWMGGENGEAPVAFVGKGVTFDTGGISLKPSGGMEDMKWDMGGAGVVIGLMRALAGRGAKANVVGVIGLVENMPSGAAQRPGDVVTTMSGQTIEVLNTDAEGRLVLADALHYCNDRFKPSAIVDLATLTGAIIVALGHERAGLFANDDKLAERLFKAGETIGERVWRFPMGEEYDRHIDSDIADMKNIGKARQAGSIAGAVLLQRFVGKTPWAHLDIAGVTWSDKDAPTVPKGGTAFGVRLLDHLVAEHYEKK